MNPKLSLKLAYAFATEHGLARETSEIQALKTHWKNEDGELDSTRVRKGFIVQLFRERGLLDEFIRERWPFGHSRDGPQKMAMYDCARKEHMAMLAGDTQEAPDALASQPTKPGDDLSSPPKTLPNGRASKTILPPVRDAESLVARVRLLDPNQAERNHEDAVKDLLVRLNIHVAAIQFQRGRIDLCVQDQSHKTVAVFEVKRSIVSAPERDKARRQANDYAAQSGSTIFVITDGNYYEIYDRRRGSDYHSMLAGRFQLAAFREEDSKNLDLLRDVASRGPGSAGGSSR
ncbi:MAG: type I restriction enzyme HsdR N-terminal domain-containing protein [Planctomycetes bacterium]|nr:type I restriction enzyme HsdR N-terminal domain-containing protein [Planctomycetota bacterium]